MVVAHRGASSDHPENTLEAFEGAIRVGADVVELDVRMTADHVPVVLHDADVSATTDGSGFVHQLTLEQVKRLDASKGAGGPIRIPTLREALEGLSGRIGVDIEVKNIPGEASFDSPREEAAEAVVRMLAEVGFDGLVLVTSFNWLSIERVRDLDPAIATGFLTTAMIDPRAALLYARSTGHGFVLPQAPALFDAGASFVSEAHDFGVRVGTWTVDDEEAISALYSMGVDAIATNDPARGVAVRDEFRSRSAEDGKAVPG